MEARHRTDTRANRAIAAVECPKCAAPIGKACWVQAATGHRPVVHTERREAYRQWRDKHYPNWNAEHGLKP